MCTNLNASDVIVLKGALGTASFSNLGHAALEVSTNSGFNDDRNTMSDTMIQRFLSAMLGHYWEPIAHNEANSGCVGNRPLLSSECNDWDGIGPFPHEGPMHRIATGNERSCLDGRYPWRCDS